MISNLLKTNSLNLINHSPCLELIPGFTQLSLSLQSSYNSSNCVRLKERVYTINLISVPSVNMSEAARMAAAKAAEINAKLLAKGVPIKREVLLPKQGHQVANSMNY